MAIALTFSYILWYIVVKANHHILVLFPICLSARDFYMYKCKNADSTWKRKSFFWKR